MRSRKGVSHHVVDGYLRRHAGFAEKHALLPSPPCTPPHQTAFTATIVKRPWSSESACAPPNSSTGFAPIPFPRALLHHHASRRGSLTSLPGPVRHLHKLVARDLSCGFSYTKEENHGWGVVLPTQPIVRHRHCCNHLGVAGPRLARTPNLS